LVDIFSAHWGQSLVGPVEAEGESFITATMIAIITTLKSSESQKNAAQLLPFLDAKLATTNEAIRFITKANAQTPTKIPNSVDNSYPHAFVSNSNDKANQLLVRAVWKLTLNSTNSQTIELASEKPSR
jgi:hypothetical protein